jgi:hypothetical protein
MGNSASNSYADVLINRVNTILSAVMGDSSKVVSAASATTEVCRKD